MGGLWSCVWLSWRAVPPLKLLLTRQRWFYLKSEWGERSFSAVDTVWIKYVSHCDSHRSLAVGFSSGGRTGLQRTAHHFKSTSFLILLFNDELFFLQCNGVESLFTPGVLFDCKDVTWHFWFTSLKIDELLHNSFFFVLRCSLCCYSSTIVTVFAFASHIVTKIRRDTACA